MKRLLVTILIVAAVLVAVLGLTIALGGPGEAPSPMSDSWRTTWKTLSIRSNWLSLPRSPDSLPAADLCFASRAVHVRNYSPTIFFFLLGSVRTQQRCVQATAAGLPWGFRASSRFPC